MQFPRAPFPVVPGVAQEEVSAIGMGLGLLDRLLSEWLNGLPFDRRVDDGPPGACPAGGTPATRRTTISRSTATATATAKGRSTTVGVGRAVGPSSAARRAIRPPARGPVALAGSCTLCHESYDTSERARPRPILAIDKPPTTDHSPVGPQSTPRVGARRATGREALEGGA